MSRSTLQTHSGLATLAALGLSLLIGACRPESSLTNASELTAADTAGFTSIGLSQAQADMAQSGIRVEVRIKPGSSPLVATELALGPANMAGEPEQVQANISAITAGGSDESVTLDLGGLKVGFDANTRFSRDGSDATLSKDEFVAAVQSGMSAGRRVHIAARRAPPASPQAPDDGAFLADQIRIGGSSDQLKIDLNAGPANLQLNTSPPPDAFFRLLGLTIEIRISDGTTRIGRRHDQVGQRVEFGGQVKSVNLDRGAFVLASGLTVRVTDQTVIVESDGIKTLADVAAALGAGAMVKAEGVGTVESTDPKVLAALKVKFEKHRPLFEFRDMVKAVEADAGKLTLNNGAVLCVDDKSMISQEGDLKSLDQVARALAAGRHVVAAGVATPGPTTSGCRATVIKIRFALLPPPVLEFRDGVKAVDVPGKKVTLAAGTVICFDDHSVINQEGDLKSLDEVAQALEAGQKVGAAGSATPGPNDTGCRATVLRVRFSIIPPLPPPVIEFHEGVKAADATAQTITLTNGIVLCLNDQTVIIQDGDLKTLADVAAALAAGKAVKAEGAVTPTPDDANCRGRVLKVKFEIRT